MPQTNRALVLVLLGLLAGGASAEQVCDPGIPASTPDSRFLIHDDGTVTDKETELQWMRCSVGQRWTGTGCSDAPDWFAMHPWEGAMQFAREVEFAGHEDWRVPTIDELTTIVEARCREPSINLGAFPNTAGWYYWSSTTFSENADYAWRVDFSNGRDNADLKSSVSYSMRLVRGGRSRAAASAALAAPVPRADSSLLRDGIHDPDNAALLSLQPPEEAMGEFPVSRLGRVDWVQTLAQGLVEPRASVDGGEDMVTMNFNIVMANTIAMPHVLFPHQAHTEWLTCSNCHPAIFKPELGANLMTMNAILLGEWCGACHGRVAFSLMECERCHSIPHEKSPAPWW